VELGITADTTGAPVISSMDTVPLGKTADGVTVFMDRAAAEADGIVVINRVKVHTSFHGPVESGLCKMTVVGLGKRGGAESFHANGLGEALVPMFEIARAGAPLLAGIAILENAADETLDIAVTGPEEFAGTDAAMLARCREIMPGLPVSRFDILVVDRMGKNISGTGMDTNVIGFWRRYGGVRVPDYDTLIVRALTPESGGNAMGIGMADLIPRRLADTIDRNATWANAMTSQWALGRIPITLHNDRACLDAALSKYPPGAARVVRIADTLHLERLQVSASLLPELADRPDIEIVSSPVPLAFDEAGNL
jgi:hypothetical protein